MGSGRQGNGEDRPLTRGGFDGYPAGVCFDDRFADRQAEAGTALPAVARDVGTPETIEDTRLLFGRQARSIVGDADNHRPVSFLRVTETACGSC